MKAHKHRFATEYIAEKDRRTNATAIFDEKKRPERGFTVFWQVQPFNHNRRDFPAGS